MTEQRLFRIGAIALMVGAVGAFVGNAIHPRIYDITDTEAYLREIAASHEWVAIHVLLLFSILLMIGGLIALFRTLKDEPSNAWARMGATSALIGGGVFGALSAIDGHVRQELAQAWMDAPADQADAAYRVAEAVEKINFGLFSVFIIVFFGVTFMMFGIAVTTSHVYPRWLGWIAAALGLVATATGATLIYQGPTNLMFNVVFTAISISLTIWVFVMGILLWRRPGSGRSSTYYR